MTAIFLLLRCKSLKLKENKKKRIACHSPSDTSQTFVGRLPPHQSLDTHALRNLFLLRFKDLLGRLTNDLAAFHVLSCSFHLRVLNPHRLDSLLLKSPSCQSTLLVCRQNPFVLKRRTPHLPSLKYHQDFSQSNPCFIIVHCYLFHTHCLPSGAKEKMAQSRSLIDPLIAWSAW